MTDAELKQVERGLREGSSESAEKVLSEVLRDARKDVESILSKPERRIRLACRHSSTLCDTCCARIRSGVYAVLWMPPVSWEQIRDSFQLQLSRLPEIERSAVEAALRNADCLEAFQIAVSPASSATIRQLAVLVAELKSRAGKPVALLCRRPKNKSASPIPPTAGIVPPRSFPCAEVNSADAADNSKGAAWWKVRPVFLAVFWWLIFLHELMAKMRPQMLVMRSAVMNGIFSHCLFFCAVLALVISVSMLWQSIRSLSNQKGGDHAA